MLTYNEATIKGLLKDGNPAVQYRVRKELLGEMADSAASGMWILGKLPVDWFDAKGLWYIYWITALAECGLDASELPAEHVQRALNEMDNGFQCSCSDFMLLRALTMLGLYEQDAVKKAIRTMAESVLPDGGFLCFRRRKGFSYTPKSCYKANLHALMFLSESRKRGVDVAFGQPVVDYFLNREVLYRSGDRSTPVLDSALETFHPFEPMRVGIHNIVESLSALGYGNDARVQRAWEALARFRQENGWVIMSQTLTKPYLPKEKAGKPSQWVTLYAMLAEKFRNTL